MTQGKINSKEFADEIFRKVECLNKFQGKIEILLTDETDRRIFRSLFSKFLIEYHQ
jgi:hypothetical protein